MPLSIRDAAFLEPVKAALQRQGEVLLATWYPGAAYGCSDWYLVHDAQELEAVLAQGQRFHPFEAYLDPQLLLHGVVDDAFKQRVLDLHREAVDVPAHLPNGRLISPPTDFLLLAVRLPGQPMLETAELDEREDVIAWLQGHWGEQAAAGLTPEYTPSHVARATTKQSIVAITPDENGSIRSR